MKLILFELRLHLCESQLQRGVSTLIFDLGVSSLPSAGPGGASEAGAEGGGPCSKGGPQENPGNPQAAVRAGAADAQI